MLRNKIQSAVGLMQDVSDNKAKKREHKAVAKRNILFFDGLKSLSLMVDSYISAHTVFSFSLENEQYKLMKELMDYANQSICNKRAIEPESFSKKVNELNKLVENEWKCFFNSKYEGLISGLAIMMTVHSDQRQIQSLLNSIKKCNEWPLKKDAVNNFTNNEERAVKLLEGMEFDANIRAFLEKVANSSATFSDITPEIYQWIFKENIADKIKLSINNDNL